MTEYKFKLMGVPSEKSVQIIEAGNCIHVSDIKKKVKKKYMLNPGLNISLILKGNIVDDSAELSKLLRKNKHEPFTVMTLLVGA